MAANHQCCHTVSAKLGPLLSMALDDADGNKWTTEFSKQIVGPNLNVLCNAFGQFHVTTDTTQKN